ncbi:MAG TPA: cation:proton antiporter [Streptosporangiaceae bacterium]|nr:cation:proton antiporter [Streptosporangiaceae bacterium]
MSTNQILIGIGLIFVLAVGSQVLASRLRIPALIVMLPAGFIVGALTSDVNPAKLLGPAFQPAVSLAVAVILYDSGLGLDMRKLQGHARNVVIKLIIAGLVLSFALTVIVAPELLGISGRAAVMLGAILVVTGPTVVGPLLAFVRPAQRVRYVLAWEGSLMDPIGAILGASVFHAVSASTSTGHRLGSQVLDFWESLGTGVAGAIVAVVLLWVLLRILDLPEVLGTSAQLAVIVAVAAGCDVLRPEAGLIAAIITGVVISNLRGFGIPARRPFMETLVQLIIGLLFVSIAATITPSSLRGLVLPTIGLVAVLVLIARPLTAALAAIGTDLTTGERSFTGWMAPRGIVAAATATTFSAALVSKHVGGAAKILPVTFLVIVATVTVYGLTASPVARHLQVVASRRSRPVLIGGQPWVIDLGRTLHNAGLDVLMWAGYQDQRDSITNANLPLAETLLREWSLGQAAELEGITAVYLLTDEDDYNALAAILLHDLASEDAPGIYRLAPPSGQETVITPSPPSEMLFGRGLNRPAIDRKVGAGARIEALPVDGTPPPDCDLLFVIDTEGVLHAATEAGSLTPRSGDVMVLLGKGASASREG